MFFDRIKRSATWAGLAAAVAFVMPALPAGAATHGGPTPLTITPALAQTTGTTSSTTSSNANSGVIEVAQNARRNRRRRANNRRKTRNQRRVRREQGNRRRATNRRQFRRGRAADRRTARRRIRHNGRWYYYRNGRYYDNTGAILAAGVIAGAAGVIAGAALADSGPDVVVVDDGVPAPYTAAWYRECDIKYNSFRASDGTYMSYSGVRRTCRLP